MTRDGSCPTQQTLSAFLRGELAAEQEEALTRHLETCPACEALAQQLEQEADPMIAALRRAPPAPLPSTMVMSAGPPPRLRHFTSPVTRSWGRSAGGAWGWCTGPTSTGSTAWWPSR